MESHALEMLMIAFQLIITIVAGSIIPWAMKVASRLTKLETLISNGMCADLRHIKEHCPGCLGRLDVVAAKLESIEIRMSK